MSWEIFRNNSGPWAGKVSEITVVLELGTDGDVYILTGGLQPRVAVIIETYRQTYFKELHYCAVQCSSVQYNAVQFSAVQCSEVHCNCRLSVHGVLCCAGCSILYTVAGCSILYTGAGCSILYTVAGCSILLDKWLSLDTEPDIWLLGGVGHCCAVYCNFIWAFLLKNIRREKGRKEVGLSAERRAYDRRQWVGSRTVICDIKYLYKLFIFGDTPCHTIYIQGLLS